MQQPNRQAADAPISATEVVEVYEQICERIAKWERPSELGMPAGGRGAWMALRWDGRIMGQAADLRWAFESEVPAECLGHVVRQVMERAAVAAEGSQGDAVEREDRKERFLISPTTVELQVARAPRRISASGLRDLSDRIRPGLDGVILEVGGQRAGMFPGQYLADDLNPSQVLFQLAGALSLGLEQVDQFLESGQARVWLFEVEHLAQARRGDPPTFLYRGSRIVPADKVRVASLMQFADDVSSHLLSRRFHIGQFPDQRPAQQFPDEVRQERPVRLLGRYEPELDVYKPFEASVSDQLLCAYALARYAQLEGQKQSMRDSARQFASELVGWYAGGAGDEEKADDGETDSLISTPGQAALWLLATEALDGRVAGLTPEEVSGARARMTEIVQSVIEPALGLRADVPTEELAICALALRSGAVNQAVWTAADDDLDPELMPWLVLAELAVERSSEKLEHEVMASLSRLAEQVWLTQITAEQADTMGLDLVGGVRVGLGGASQRRIPDWSNARWIAGLAAIAADERATQEPAEQMSHIAKLALASRFLMQLSVRDCDTYCVAAAEQALGGVRERVSSWSLRPEPSAMTLLAVVEMLEGMERLAQSQAPD
ncbi:MAG: hypothetical protein D8M59_08075 [Planctomycetes bacterium]|nr:hypothetical protein [Planctomycetota bacterium]NOG53281.1 hypothetical protein [Planctomycetota bacterium]